MKIREFLKKTKERIFGKQETMTVQQDTVKAQGEQTEVQQDPPETAGIGEISDAVMKRAEEMATQIDMIGKAAEEVTKVMVKYMENINRIVYDSLDEWQKKKLEIPNNERKRTGKPMVRRRAYLRNVRNRRKR